ncbi:class I SAM-dependent methyltransferase [Paenarthrobacter sp. CM16]|uniref:class I SAM-dependent methyltransferase n=1 Tax=Paenarthrobacter sp. CM16 TaxID=2738447 RepID=UPI0015568042|nr:class I SAM-dependent methyltransferase [Paenarthrobacter sp. CM16]NQD90088.1 class I SAM-dependent methyltransferase [Paenarthrobacter sp. CM16]
MGSIAASEFLSAGPDASIDHNYLTASEIAVLPLGVYYKKKSVLTRHRFIKASISVDGDCFDLEVIDFKGYWRVDQTSLLALLAWIRQRPGQDAVDEVNVLSVCGLDGVVEPLGTPVEAKSAKLPTSLAEMAEFYSAYTDMAAQGHFDPDSPDLERLEIIVGWIPDGSTVIDVGCNSGAFGTALLKKNCAVCGIDLSHELVSIARLRGVDAVQGFAEELPFGNKTFDVAICAELLEHVLDPIRVLSEIIRVLKPGGILVGSVPHGDGAWGHSDIGHHDEHLRAFSEIDLRLLLKAQGFVGVVTVEQLHGSDVAQGLAFKCSLPE